MSKQIQIRRDIATNWSSTNPVLANGEMGYDTTNGIIKFGDGTGTWTSLSNYTTPVADGSVSPVKLDNEFKTTVALSGTDVDWSSGVRFTKTITAVETLTFSNLHVGMKLLEITGDFAITLPTGFTYAGGTRASLGASLIQVVCTDTTTPKGWYIILKDES